MASQEIVCKDHLERVLLTFYVLRSRFHVQCTQMLLRSILSSSFDSSWAKILISFCTARFPLMTFLPSTTLWHDFVPFTFWPCYWKLDKNIHKYSYTVGWAAWKLKNFFLHFWVLLDLTKWEIGIKSGSECLNMPRIGSEVRYLRPYFSRFI